MWIVNSSKKERFGSLWHNTCLRKENEKRFGYNKEARGLEHFKKIKCHVYRENSISRQKQANRHSRVARSPWRTWFEYIMISSLKSFSLAIFNRKLCVAINSGYTEPQKSAHTNKVYHKKKWTEEFQKCSKVNQRRTVGLQSKMRKVFRDPYPTLTIRTLCLTHSST